MMQTGWSRASRLVSVAVDGSGATYVYWEGTDGNVWEGYWNGSAWTGPFNRGMGPLG